MLAGKYLVCSPSKARDFFLEGKWWIWCSWSQPAWGEEPEHSPGDWAGSTLSCFLELCLTQRQSRINMWTFPKAAVAEAFELGVETLGTYSYVWDAGPLPQWGQQAADKAGCWRPLDTAAGPRPLHFTVFLIPFCQDRVTCIKRRSQSCDWHHAREIALSLSAGLGSSRGLVLYSCWVMVPARHGHGVWSVAGGFWSAHGYWTWFCLLDTGGSLETWYQHARVPGRKQQQVQAHQQRPSLEKNY